MFSFFDMFGRSVGTIRVVDVGAMWVGWEYVPYRALLKAGKASVVGFEPDESECRKLNDAARGDQRYLPYYIGDGAERTYHLCQRGMVSSLYEPNLPLLSMFPNLAEAAEVVERRTVPTRRLDDLPEIGGMDLLKVDVQGAELDVFAGARRLLAGALVVHAEVSFVPLYRGQPLFGDVDAALRASGYLLHGLLGPTFKAFKPLPAQDLPGGRGSQLMWADAVYVRDFTRLDALEAADLLKLAAIAHEMYGSHDLAALALTRHDERAGSDLARHYAARVAAESRRR